MTEITERKAFARLLQQAAKSVLSERAAGKPDVLMVDLDHEIADALTISFSKFRMWKYQTPPKIDTDELFALIWFLVFHSTTLGLSWIHDFLQTTVLGIGLEAPKRSYLSYHFMRINKPPTSRDLESVLNRLFNDQVNNADKLLYWVRNDELLDRDQETARVRELLKQPSALVCVTGMGGIGKTSLAYSVGQSMLEQGEFDRVVWISVADKLFGTTTNIAMGNVTLTLESVFSEIARQVERPDLLTGDPKNKLGKFKGFLSSKAVLLILDNLETVSDVESLIMTLDLELLAGSRSSMLMTSRRQFAYDPIRKFELHGLSQVGSATLICNLIEANSLSEIDTLSQDQLTRIHHATHGHPLAIRLVVGQMAKTHNLEYVLSRLEQSHHTLVEHFYTFIYRWLWEEISEDSHYLLLALANLPPNIGEEISFIHNLLSSIESPVVDDRFYSAIHELRQVSLVEMYRRESKLWYALHTLTRNFILSDIVRQKLWDGGST